MKDNYAEVMLLLKMHGSLIIDPRPRQTIEDAIALLTRYREGLELIRDDTAITFEGQQLCKIARKTIGGNDD